MCADYTDINRARLKDSYLLPNIDKLADNLVGYQFISFVDSYSGYNQIPMFRLKRVRTTVMTEKANYQYNAMPFRLNNVDATYQRMMNNIFQEEIGEALEVYMNDMIVKSGQEELHTYHLQGVFKKVQQYDM